jgi:hypothetical protein
MIGQIQPMGDDEQKNSFSAAPSAVGYLYQARLALHLALGYANRESGIEVSVEALDDISFDRDGTGLELLQTKHRMDRAASLTDSGTDLWKTIRIWAEACAKDPSLPGRTRFALITTGTAADGSVAALLRPSASYVAGQRRDPKAAAVRLTEIAQTSTNASLKSAFGAFLGLQERMRASLLSAVEILDRQPNLVEVESHIDDALRMVATRGNLTKARELMEGWWWPRICKALMSSPPEPIAVGEIEARLDEVREMLKRDNLPVEFEDAEPSEAEVAGYDAFRFIDQLKAVGLTGPRLQWAKRDFYRAFVQRSKWTRDHAVHDGELALFEKRLVEEWEPRFEIMKAKNDGLASHEPRLQSAGQELFTWVETEARFPFRSVVSRFLSVGSYHILANDIRVGWHRDFKALFEAKE